MDYYGLSDSEINGSSDSEISGSSDSEINDDDIELQNKLKKLKRKLKKEKEPFIVNVSYNQSIDLHTNFIPKLTSQQFRYICYENCDKKLDKILTKLVDYDINTLLVVNEHKKRFVRDYLMNNLNRLKINNVNFNFIELFISHELTPHMINLITSIGDTWEKILNYIEKIDEIKQQNYTFKFFNILKKYDIQFDAKLTTSIIYSFCNNYEVDELIKKWKLNNTTFDLHILLDKYRINKDIKYSIFYDDIKIDFNKNHFRELKKIINYFYEPNNLTPKLTEFIEHISVEIPKVIIPLDMHHFEFYYNAFQQDSCVFNSFLQSFNFYFNLLGNVEIGDNYHIINGKKYMNDSKEIKFYKILTSYSQ